MYCWRKKRVFEKISKWPVTPTFLSLSLFSSTCSRIGLFMFKIPDFSHAPWVRKQVGVDLVSAWKDVDPRTLVSGEHRPFCMTVHCAAHAHCDRATLTQYLDLTKRSFTFNAKRQCNDRVSTDVTWRACVRTLRDRQCSQRQWSSRPFSLSRWLTHFLSLSFSFSPFHSLSPASSQIQCRGKQWISSTRCDECDWW